MKGAWGAGAPGGRTGGSWGGEHGESILGFYGICRAQARSLLQKGLVSGRELFRAESPNLEAKRDGKNSRARAL